MTKDERTIEEILAMVFNDGIVVGSGSIAQTNYKSTDTRERVREILGYAHGDILCTTKTSDEILNSATNAIMSLFDEVQGKQELDEKELRSLIKDVVAWGIHIGKDTEEIIEEQVKAICAKFRKPDESWITGNGEGLGIGEIIFCEIEHCNKELNEPNRFVTGHFVEDGFVFEDGGELSHNWDIVRYVPIKSMSIFKVAEQPKQDEKKWGGER